MANDDGAGNPICQLCMDGDHAAGVVMQNFRPFLGVAIGIFTVIALFQVITLPVEFDASRRAKQQLLQIGLVQARESEGVTKVLNAAALTYVAAMVTAIFQLLHFIMLARGSSRIKGALDFVGR
jgi:Zn-dependent membrane protease YugP